MDWNQDTADRSVTDPTNHNVVSRDSAVGRSTIGFVFDIDGVLVRGTEPIRGARETLMRLREQLIPFALLTNSGGQTEKKYAERLTKYLGVAVDERQLVLSHSPFRCLVEKYRDKLVLAVGGFAQHNRDTALDYGFNKVITTSDLIMAHKHIHSQIEMTGDHHAEHARVLPEDPMAVSLILVFSTPRDWFLDLQLISDLLLSRGGIVGTRSPKNGDKELPNYGYLQDGQPALWFANPDFEWASAYEQPRFSQGAFREALKGIWAHATKGQAELFYQTCGKPTKTTFQWGEQALHEYHQFAHADGHGHVPTIKTVYMVGDNPESDIRGANGHQSERGVEWKSVLVETGMYVPGTEPAHKPTQIATDVEDAVDWALKQEGLKK